MAQTFVQTQGFSFIGALKKMTASTIAFMDALMQAASRAQKVEELQALSDAQLAKKGLKREDIVAHVFADRIWM